MECLINSIGLFNPQSGCNAPPSLFNIYLNQLPGIEIQNIDGIANADQISFDNLWNDLQATTAQSFRDDVIAEFEKRYMLNQITQSVDLGKKINTTSLTPVVNQNGILLELAQDGQQCIGSNLSSLYVQSVNFYFDGSSSPATFTLTFKDADTLTVEDSIVVNAVQGWNSVFIDKTFLAKRLYILATGNFSDYVKLDISEFFLSNFNQFQWGFNTNYLWFNWAGCGNGARVQGVDYDTRTDTAITGTNTFGVSCIFSVKCTFDTVVCNNKRHFVSAWQMALAIELMNYRINSSRLNRWTTINKEQALELRKLFLQKYHGGKNEDTGINYPGKLQTAITSLVLNDQDGCLKPNDYIMWRETQL